MDLEEPRLEHLVSLLRSDREQSVSSLSRQLDISPSTVRRDLTRLSKTGKIQRTHGGARLRRTRLMESDFEDKMSTAVDAKQRIAHTVAEQLPAGATVFVDAGSTCLEAGRALMRRGDCRLYTTSIPLLVDACSTGTPVTALGGEVRMISRALIGPGTLSGLDQVRIDVALIGASGLDPLEGTFTTEPLEAEVKSTAMKRAREAWLLADRSKWKTAAALRFADWGDFTHWILEDTAGIDFPLPSPTLLVAKPLHDE